MPLLLVAPLIALASAIGPQVQAAPPLEIRVQVLDARTHRPVKSRQVYLSFSGRKELWPRNAPTMTSRTGADGIVTFAVVQPALAYLAVEVRWAYPCESEPSYPTNEVTRDGVISRWTTDASKKQNKWCTANAKAPEPQTRPGTIVFLVHPMNRFVWAWYDTWK